VDDEEQSMKKGFAILIQDGLEPVLHKQAVDFANDFIAKTCSDPNLRYFGVKGGGYTSGIWRGRLGLTIGKTPLVFRRVSKHLRKFAIVKKDTMEVHNDHPLWKTHFTPYQRDKIPDGPIPEGCSCPVHGASINVKFVKEPKWIEYAKIGDIKG
jgi:hypothetical protein